MTWLSRWRRGRSTFIAGSFRRTYAVHPADDVSQIFVSTEARRLYPYHFVTLEGNDRIDVIAVRERYGRVLRVLRRFAGDRACLEASTKAAAFLDNVAIFLPSRIVNEDLGDYLEDVNRRAREGQSPTKIYLRTATAAFWLIVNTVGYLARAVGARKSA